MLAGKTHLRLRGIMMRRQTDTFLQGRKQLNVLYLMPILQEDLSG